MPSDFSQLTNLAINWNNAFHKAAEILAESGEEYIRRGDWQDDTGSLRASITGYEASTGDPYKHVGDPAWEKARAEGSKKYGTPPSNYRVDDTSEDLGESDHPVAVVCAMVPYAMASPDVLNPIGPVMEALFRDAINHLIEQADDAVDQAFGFK